MMGDEPDIIAEMQRLNEEFWYRMANISAIDDKNEWAEALKKHPGLIGRLDPYGEVDFFRGAKSVPNLKLIKGGGYKVKKGCSK